MFCQNCGKALDLEAKFCQYCGCKVGQSIPKEAQQIAMQPVAQQPQYIYVKQYHEKKDQGVAFILCFLIGGMIGIHDFYMRRTWAGITKIILALTIIGLIVNFFWCIVDLIAITMKIDDCFYTNEELEERQKNNVKRKSRAEIIAYIFVSILAFSIIIGLLGTILTVTESNTSNGGKVSEKQVIEAESRDGL